MELVIKNKNPEPESKIVTECSNKYPQDFINKIICGDCVEILKSIPDNEIDLVVTSPPYDDLRTYNGFSFTYPKIAKELYRIVKKGGIVVWVVGDKIDKGNRSLTSLRQAISFQETGFKVHDMMIYKKKNTPFMRSNAYTNCHELMFVFSKGTPNTFNPLIEPTKRNGFEMLITNKKADGINKKVLGQLKETKVKTNIWEYAVGLGGTTNDSIAFKHPAIFPEKLAEDHILSWSNVGDVVLDPMCGSGTTCKMAKMNNRNYIGIDISKEYCEIAMNRLINSYLFSWDDIPGKDKARLIEFLKKRFGIEWLETAKIKKTNSGKTINMFTEDNFLFLELNGEKTKVNLTINDIRTDEFITRVENGSILVC